jgi:hypothetical protein
MALIDKIAGLLAMAERTENEHEAEAFLQKAQELATNNSIDLALARAATARAERREQPTTKTVVIGEARQHANRQLVELMIAICRVNDLQIDIAHNSTYVILFGMPSDIEVAEAMFNSIAVQMISACTEWLRRGEWRNEKYQQAYHNGRGKTWTESRPVNARMAKASFNHSFTVRIAERLQSARADVVQARSTIQKADDRFALVSLEVVLLDKAKEVKAFHKTASSARGSWSGYTGKRGASSRGAKAGKSAADRARISKVAELS